MLIFMILLAAFSFGTNSFGVGACDHTATAFRCVKYVYNYDGDTVTFDIPGTHPLFGKGISIRIKGIDTPEIRSKDDCEKRLAKVARNYIAYKFEDARNIELHESERGKYFRIVAKVKVDGKFLAPQLISRGLAVPYWGDTKEDVDWCQMEDAYNERFRR